MPGIAGAIAFTHSRVVGLTGAVAELGGVITTTGAIAQATFAQIRAGVEGAISDFQRLRQLMGTGPGTGGAGAFAQTQQTGLEGFMERVRGAEEANPALNLGISAMIENELERIATGQTTVAQAIADLMRYLGNQYNLIQREFTLSTDASIRQLGQDILRFINSGQTPASIGGGGTGTAAPGTGESRAVTGGVGSNTGFTGTTGTSGGFGGTTGASTGGFGGGSTAGTPITYGPAIRELIPIQGEIRAMGDALTVHMTEQVRVVLQGLQQQGNITPQQTERVLARLREVQSDFRERIDPNRLFNPLIEGQIRPMRRDIGEIRRSTAMSSRWASEFDAALERLQTSGFLTSGTTQ